MAVAAVEYQILSNCFFAMIRRRCGDVRNLIQSRHVMATHRRWRVSPMPAKYHCVTTECGVLIRLQYSVALVGGIPEPPAFNSILEICCQHSVHLFEIIITACSAHSLAPLFSHLADDMTIDGD